MKNKKILLLLLLSLLLVSYFLLPSSPALKEQLHHLTTIFYPTATKKKIPAPPSTTSQQASNSHHYSQLIAAYQERLGDQVKITIKTITRNKKINWRGKQRIVQEVVISTQGPQGKSSFQAYLDPQTQKIIQQWNFKRPEGLFIKQHRPKPLHPTGEILPAQ